MRVTDGRRSILLATANGMSIRFPETDVRPMGRATNGVRGIALRKGDRVVGMEVLAPDATILTVTERGYGKRSRLDRVPRAGARRHGHHQPQGRPEDRRGGRRAQVRAERRA